MSLATKYRPKEFNEVCGQQSIINILSRQVEVRNFSNCYLFSGPSGCGKTTLARIFARKINGGSGNPIELDAASNNGVDNIRTIITESRERSLDSEYKVFIIDECHMITTAGWNAFLKCIEEPPKYTIFIFCTTDPQKIPETILNRVMKFSISKLPDVLIERRLSDICSFENIYFDEASIKYITKISNGGMRDAISALDKVYQYSNVIDINLTTSILGNYSYDSMFDLTNLIIDGNRIGIISLVESLHSDGTDLKVFLDEYIDFILDLTKFTILKDSSSLSIPVQYINAESSNVRSVKYTTGIENNVAFFNKLLDKLMDAKLILKTDSSIKTTLIVLLLKICGE